MRYHFYIFLFLTINLLAAQDEFTLFGEYTPNYSAELLDAEIYSSDVLYMVGVGGFIFIDISNIKNPSLMGRYNTGNIYKRFYNGKSTGNLAAGAARRDGLYFINTTFLSNPSLYKIHNPGNFAYESVDFNDSLAYAAIHENGIEIINIKNPTNPVSIYMIVGLNNTWDVFIKDEYLYVADGGAGIKVFSLLDPVHPQLVGQISTTGSAFEVIVENQYAYVALGAAGFDIIDVSSHENPIPVTNFNPGFGILNHLAYANNTIFAASWELVFAINVSNPFYPELMATEDTPLRAMGIAAQNNRVYVTDWANLEIYTYHPLPQPDIHIKPTSYDFGYPGANIPSVKNFDVYNLGETELIVSNIYINDMTYYTIEPTQMTINPGEKQSLEVTFSIAQSQYLNHNMIFTSNDPDESQKQVNIFAGNQRIFPGQPAPDFTLNDLNGNQHTLSDYRGKVVLMAIFASW